MLLGNVEIVELIQKGINVIRVQLFLAIQHKISNSQNVLYVQPNQLLKKQAISI